MSNRGSKTHEAVGSLSHTLRKQNKTKILISGSNCHKTLSLKAAHPRFQQPLRQKPPSFTSGCSGLAWGKGRI